MSRSKRKTPIIGRAGTSEKEDKRQNNRRYRRIFKQCLHIDPFAEVFPHLREHSNPWEMAKDGKSWFNPDENPELMRK